MLKRVIGYVKDAEILGEVKGIDFENEMVFLKDDDESYTFRASDVEFLEEVFELNETIIFDKDVLGDAFGNLYLVERFKDGDVKLHILTDKLEVKDSGEKFTMTDSIQEDFEEVFTLVGNLYELKNRKPKEPTFNVQIVKDFNGEHYTYFYACNNKKDKEIDLIKVLFLGSTLIEEEEHERRTLDYDTYMEAIESGAYKEVSPQELQNYVTGMLYGKTNSFVDAEEEVEEEEEETLCVENCGCVDECEKDGGRIFHFDFSKVFAETEEDKSEPDTDTPVAPAKCDKCGQYESDCDCDLWD